MLNSVLILVLSVILREATTQNLDDMTLSSTPVINENTESTIPPCSTESKWEELLPALQAIKSSSKIKKERLFNVVKIIKFLLSDELPNNKWEEANILKEIKEKIKEPGDDMFPSPPMPNIERIIEERLKSIKEVTDDKNYMLEKAEIKNKTEIKKDIVASKNTTADSSKLISKITAALSKLKEQNQSSEMQTPTMVPIFRPKNGCRNDFNPPIFENPIPLGNSVPSQTGINPMSSPSMFNIPCQRASDILEETANFPLPKEALCNDPTVNLRSLAKNTKLNLDNLPFDNIVPNSVTCEDSDNSIAVLFKPKNISLMQVYGNLLKKITITVLVPYYVSKLAF